MKKQLLGKINEEHKEVYLTYFDEEKELTAT